MAELGEDKRPAALAESIEASFAAREKDAAIISAARELVDLIRAAPSDHPAVQKLIKAVDDHPQTKEGTSDGKEANKAEGP